MCSIQIIYLWYADWALSVLNLATLAKWICSCVLWRPALHFSSFDVSRWALWHAIKWVHFIAAIQIPSLWDMTCLQLSLVMTHISHLPWIIWSQLWISLGLSASLHFCMIIISRRAELYLINSQNIATLSRWFFKACGVIIKRVLRLSWIGNWIIHLLILFVIFQNLRRSYILPLFWLCSWIVFVILGLFEGIFEKSCVHGICAQHACVLGIVESCTTFADWGTVFVRVEDVACGILCFLLCCSSLFEVDSICGGWQWWSSPVEWNWRLISYFVQLVSLLSLDSCQLRDHQLVEPIVSQLAAWRGHPIFISADTCLISSSPIHEWISEVWAGRRFFKTAESPNMRTLDYNLLRPIRSQHLTFSSLDPRMAQFLLITRRTMLSQYWFMSNIRIYFGTKHILRKLLFMFNKNN